MRTPALQEFVDKLRAGFAEHPRAPEINAVIAQLNTALAKPGASGSQAPGQLPVCRELPPALMMAREASPVLARLAAAFAAVEPSLKWITRTSGAETASANWPEGHANAVIIGPGGAEERSDIMIGASLLAPKVRYPDHHHGPEEIYLVLTPGRFQHGESDWFEPGPGGMLHNVPNIKHAMAAGDKAPLLAIWCLLLI